MGFLSGLMGRASETDKAQIESELAALLIEDEHVEKAYKLVRDLLVFTNRRLITVDKQGITGKKCDYTSIPYRAIVRFSIETAGHLDLDAELKIWQSGSQTAPIGYEFKRGKAIDEVYRVLSRYVL